MAKGLTFNLGGKSFCVTPVKLERKKMYGWQEKLVFDESGGECALAYTDDSGLFTLPRGGVGQGILNPEGEWVERSALKAVREDGGEAALIPSSFDTQNSLHKIATPEEFLNYTITGAYMLQGDTSFAALLGNDIYTFEYIYREGYETTRAFVLQSGGAAFMLLGYDSHFEMLALDQCVEIDSDDEVLDDDDEIDFSFI